MLNDYINNKPTIKNETIILRPLDIGDVDDLREWTPNKCIYKYWGKNPGKNDLNPELLFIKKGKPTKSIHLGIELVRNKKIIGYIYIYLIEKNKKAKIAIRINPIYQNQGIGTKAINTMVNWCFINTELTTIWTDVDINNFSSIMMLKNCGFKMIKEVNNEKMVSTMCDYYIFEIKK